MDRLYYSVLSTSEKTFAGLKFNDVRRLSTFIPNITFDSLSKDLHTLIATEKISPGSFQILFEKIFSLVCSINGISSNYFDDYFDFLVYEIIFSVFNDANIALSPKTAPIDSRIGIKAWTGLTDTEDDYFLRYERTISERKTAIIANTNMLTLDFPYRKLHTPKTSPSKSLNFKDSKTIEKSAMQLKLSQSQKATAFNTFLQVILLQPEGKLSSISNGKDALFNIEQYIHFIYRPENFDKGIQFYNFYNTIDNYLRKWMLKDEAIPFSYEYSAYLLEQIHYATQYEQCLKQFVTLFADQNFVGKIADMPYFLLLIYTKLFDTHYISLTDYIEKKYPMNFSLNIDSDFYYDAFIEMQLLNAFILPLIDYTVKALLFVDTQGEISEIKSITKNYLEMHYQEKKEALSYHYKLMELQTKLNNEYYHYPYSNKSLLEDTSKNTTKEHQLNHHLSRAFFEKDIPDFFLLYMKQKPKENPINFPLIHQLIADYYTILKGTYHPKTLSDLELQEKMSQI